jgi:hypothetical protein
MRPLAALSPAFRFKITMELMMSENLSAMARGPEGQALVRFAGHNDLPDDWSDTKIQAMLSGNRLDNATGATLTDLDERSPDGINREYLVHLEGCGVCVVNLATILAMATAWCRHQQDLAKSVARDYHDKSIGRGASHVGTAGAYRD